MVASAVFGAAAAALSTAAAPGDDSAAVAASVQALRAPMPETGTGDSVAVPAEVPLNGRTALSVEAARTRDTSIRGTRAARARQIALLEAARPRRVLPLPKGSYRISSSYGPRWGTTHRGLDMAAPAGTPIYAAADGVVLAPVGMRGYGNVVVLQHPDGQVTLYAHASKVLVDPGERVKAGQVVALVGSTGNSTGNHLHFEVRKGLTGDQSEPVAWLKARGVEV